MTNARLLLVAATCVVAGCTDGAVGPAGSRGGVTLTGSGAAAMGLVGEWRRQLVFFDEFGYVHSSETRWTFSEGGDAVRAIITTNFTLGVSETAYSFARWRTDAGTVIIEFTSPNPGTIVLDYRIEGSSLFLAGQEYLRA